MEKEDPIVTGESPLHRSILVSLLLSIFFPGMGQVYNGQVGKGFLILLTAIFILPWIYGIYDAGMTSHKINNNTLHLKPSEVTIAGCLAVYIICLASPYFVYVVFNKQIHNYIVKKQEADAKNILLTVSKGIESFAENNGEYPDKFSQLYFSKSPYVNELYCDVTIDSYYYKCLLHSEGYTLTAIPEKDKSLHTFSVVTGGRFIETRLK